LSYKNCFKRIAGIAGMLLALALAQPAESQTRIAGAIKNEERVTLKGTTSSLLAKSQDTGRMAGGQNLGRMLLLLTPTAEQELAAEQLVADLHDPSSSSYHKWLTPAQFGQQFGVSESDATQVQQWLQTKGMTVHEVSQSRRFIVFSGTVSQVQDAFSTEIHTYTYNLNGKATSFISNSTDIQIPAALQPVVKGVVRLHSDPRMPSAFLGGKIKFKKTPGYFTFGDAHYMTPADFAKIYNVKPLYNAGIDGTGQTIAIVSRSSLSDPYYGFDGLQDIRDFRSLVGLPANVPELIVNGDDPQVNSFDDAIEAMLDVTWAGAVAPMAHIKMVASQSNFADGVDVSAAYIVDHLLAPVMSTSFGSCEQNMGPVGTAFYNSLWQQAAAEGITSFVSSGDDGGAGCDSPGGGTYATGFGSMESPQPPITWLSAERNLTIPIIPQRIGQPPTIQRPGFRRSAIFPKRSGMRVATIQLLLCRRYGRAVVASALYTQSPTGNPRPAFPTMASAISPIFRFRHPHTTAI
jgi:subtilase family serine protease